MLRISVNNAPGEVITLILDGQLTGRWVKLLKSTYALQAKSGQVAIDLKNVSFADREGIALLRSLVDSRVEMRNVMPFMAEQIVRAATESRDVFPLKFGDLQDDGNY